jgi:hypothetical protein
MTTFQPPSERPPLSQEFRPLRFLSASEPGSQAHAIYDTLVHTTHCVVHSFGASSGGHCRTTTQRWAEHGQVPGPGSACTALYCNALHCTALYCTVPYCTARTVLHCTALHCREWLQTTRLSHPPPMILLPAPGLQGHRARQEDNRSPVPGGRTSTEYHPSEIFQCRKN